MKTTFTYFLILTATIALFSQNNALVFDGSNDYVDCSTINLSGSSITLECWVKVDNFNDPGQGVISLIGTEQSGNSAFLRLGDGGVPLALNKVQFVLLIGGTQIKLNGSQALTSNTWYHIAGVYDSSTGMKIYINGNLDVSNSQSGNFVSNSLFYIGNNKIGDTRFIDGCIDEVRVWNNARTKAEIRQNMYCELSDPSSEANLIAYYQFNETSGTILTDSKGSLDGTLTNMVGTEWQTSSAMYASARCLDVNGSQYGVIPGNAAYTNANFTVEFWVQMDVPSVGWGGILDNGRDNNSNFYFMTVSGGWGLIFGVGNGSGVSEIWRWTDSHWHHIAGVYDGSTMYLYYDGVLDQTASVSLSTSVRDIVIGKRGPYSQYFNGKIDELRIWSDVRTDEEIRSNMYKKMKGTESNLVGYFPLDDNSVSNLIDLSNTNNDASMYSGSMVSSEAYNVWLNSSSTSWSTSSNWSRASTPSSSDNVGILLQNTSPIISTGPSIRNLYFEAGSTPSITSSFDISGYLITDENIDLNGNTITFGSSATLFEKNGHFYGATGQIETTRNLSNISEENVGGLGAVITTSENMGSTNIVRRHAALICDENASVERYYIISPTNNSGLDATLTFSYTEDELNGNIENELSLYRSTDAGTSWTNREGTVNSDDNTVSLSEIDAFSWWAVAKSNSILPVELIEFSAKCVDNVKIEIK
ncbi:MAG: LamG domain-containing protein [Bacteroidales bacterium]|nr:LamG domain-containing protein [Bacteroidales bacterium]